MKIRKKTSPIWLLPSEDFKLLVTEGKSATDILAFFGLSNKGGNSRTLWDRIKYEQIDEEHIRTAGKNNSKNALTKANLPIRDEEVFTENSTYARHLLKKRIINQKIIPYVCGVCGQEPFWNEQPMVLILDHINGVSNDNRLDNLRFVCGNCNTQLPTNAGKNKRKY